MAGLSRTDELGAYEVQFGHGLSLSQAARFFTMLGGLHLPSGGTRLRSSLATFELVATAGGLRYVLNLPGALAATTRRQLLTALPEIGLAPTAVPLHKWSIVEELHANLADVAGAADLFAPTLLASFHGLAAGEVVMTQLVFAPMNVAAVVAGVAALPCVMRIAVAEAAEPGRKRNKRKSPTRATRDQLAVRPAELLDRVRAAYRTVGVTRLRTLRPAWNGWVNDRAPALSHWPQVLSPEALAIVSGMPIGSPMVPGLPLGRSKQLAPHPAILSTGRPIGVSTFAGDEQLLTLSPQDRLRGLYVVGPVGSGKTTLLRNMIAGDMADPARYGLTVMDAKGGNESLFEQALSVVPRERISDVVVLDLADIDRPVGFNVLAGGKPERITSEVTALLDKLFDFSSNSPRALDVLRAAVMTLAQAKMTLCEVSILLEPGPRGQRFRDRVLAGITNTELLAFWRWFVGLSSRDKAEVAAPIQRRLRSVLLYPQLRWSLGQTSSGIDMDDVLETGKILLVPLGRGELGGEVAQLVGSLAVLKLWSAVQRRRDQTKIHFWFLDEFQDVVKYLGSTVGEVASQTRGYDVGLTLAHQHTTQLTDRMRDEVFADLRSKVVFQTDQDTRRLAAQLGRGVESHDIQELRDYEVFTRLHVAGRTLPTCTARTFRATRGPDLGQAVRVASRTTFGMPAKEVEAQIAARHGDVYLPLAQERARAEVVDRPVPDDLSEGWEPWEE